MVSCNIRLLRMTKNGENESMAKDTLPAVSETGATGEIAMTEFLEGTDQKFVLEKESTRMQRSIKYIQAFDITITSWEGKFKLSQDKNEQDMENAKQELIKKSGEDASGFINSIF